MRRCGWRCSRGIGRLVVGVDLVDAESDVGEQQAALDYVAAVAADSPGTQEDSTADCHADQYGVLAVEGWESGDPVEEVDCTANDAGREHEETDHPAITSVAIIDQVSRDLTTCLDDKQRAETLAELEDGRAVSEELVPTADEEILKHPLPAKDPLLHARCLVQGLGGIVQRAADPIRIIAAFHTEFVETPYEEAWYDDDLQGGIAVCKKPSPR